MNKKNTLPPYVIKLETNKTSKFNKINLFFVLFVIVVYVFIFIITPHTINSGNLNQLNLFLDKYLFGCFLPEISDKFSFKMKVVWCFSWVINFVIFCVCLFYFPLIFNLQEIISIYTKIYNKKNNSFLLFIKRIIESLCVMAIGFFGGIYPYTYGNPTYYSKGYKIFTPEFFYQNLYPAFILFLGSMLIVLIGIFILVLNFIFMEIKNEQ